MTCHGPDEGTREADLRLDRRDDAIADLGGYQAIVPGQREQSEFWKRIVTSDPDDKMPPPESGRTLTHTEIELLGQWIDSGAGYAEHWAFVKPTRPSLPSVIEPDWPETEIDFFVLNHLESQKATPSPPADRYTLIRRVSLDLTGLPPSPEAIHEYVHDSGEDAYLRMVNRHLASPTYGERWARLWLDLARYADSAGYGSDPLRVIWKYRDWTINAFNRNLPYDQLTTHQLAGDLLENPSTDQLLATAFHRNTKTNTEGGTDDEEFRVEAVKDRTDTTVQVWMGLTMGCAKCHSHKYDPISHEDYYRVFAFFNQSEDTDLPSEEPRLPTPTPAQAEEQHKLEDKISDLEDLMKQDTQDLAESMKLWEQSLEGKTIHPKPDYSSWHSIGPFSITEDQNGFDESYLPETEHPVNLEARFLDNRLNWIKQGGWKNGKSSTLSQVNSVYYAHREIECRYSRRITLAFTADQGFKVWLNGNALLERSVKEPRKDSDAIRITVALEEGKNDILVKLINRETKGRFQFDTMEKVLPGDIWDIWKTAEEERSEEQLQEFKQHHRSFADELADTRSKLSQQEKQLKALKGKIVSTPILRELEGDERRKTHILVKGNFLNQSKEVSAGTMEGFFPMPEDSPPNRLGLARWITSRDNPLTARVAVNRLWAQLFGIGLVETEENFGTQGSPPSHPELLDWLALEFMDNGWDMKGLLKTILLSATYRQDSRIRTEEQKQDPDNRMLSRGPRFRMEAEMVRDQALALSGMLSYNMLGPSVYPPQPPDMWRAAFNGQRNWATSKGENRFRRGLYVFLRRTVPYPSMATFDAPSRETCSIRRIRTNTPLQALVTLNDPAYVELAQALALRIINSRPTGLENKIGFGLELCLGRPAEKQSIGILKELYQQQLSHYQSNPEESESLTQHLTGPHPQGLKVPEWATWTVLANVLMNLDGVMMKY